MDALAEDGIVEMDQFRLLLEDKIDPIRVTIERLERQQEQILGVISNQKAIELGIVHLQALYAQVTVDNTKIHDGIFATHRVLEAKIEEIREASRNKLWDILKLIIAAAFGGLVAILMGKR